MKLLALTALFALTGTALAAAVPELAARNDCGASGAPYMRRTNSPCGDPNDHTYCGCDQTGIVRSPPHIIMLSHTDKRH
jgi:hypothetical protein